MPRVAHRLRLRPERVDEYVEAHAAVYPGLLDLISASGIRDYTIWLDGIDLLLTWEADDPAAAGAYEPDAPVRARWSEAMHDLFDERVHRDGAGTPREAASLGADEPPGPIRTASRAILRPGAGEAFAAALAARPPEALEAQRAAGLRRRWDWIDGTDAFTYLECDDPEALEDAAAGSAAHLDWLRTVEPLLDEATLRDGRRPMREVFRLD
jgi:L-rhamnose mutarotase